MGDFADYSMLEEIDYKVSQSDFDTGLWKGIKIEDMDEKYLLNTIRYLVKNPPSNALGIDSWSDKIKELLDELCVKYKQDFPLMDYDLLG